MKNKYLAPPSKFLLKTKTPTYHRFGRLLSVTFLVLFALMPFSKSKAQCTVTTLRETCNTSLVLTSQNGAPWLYTWYECNSSGGSMTVLNGGVPTNSITVFPNQTTNNETKYFREIGLLPVAPFTICTSAVITVKFDYSLVIANVAGVLTAQTYSGTITYNNYQWYKTGSGPIGSATNSTYTPTSSGSYYLMAIASCGGTRTSNSINFCASNTQCNPTAVTYATCSTAYALSFTPTPSTGYNVYWYECNSSGGSGSILNSGTPTNNLTVYPNSSTGNQTNYYYYVSRDNFCTSICTSAVITVKWDYDLEIVSDYASPPTYSVQPYSGITYSSYQWYKGGSSISGANSPAYSPTTSGSYNVMASPSCGGTRTSNAIIYYAPNTQCNATPQTLATCASSYTLSFTPASGYSVDWYSCNSSGGSGSLISNSNSYIVYPASTTVNETQYYYYVCTDNYSNVPCTSAVITLKYDYVIGISGGTVPSTTLSYSPYSSLNTYNNFQWYKNGVSLGAAGNASTYNATLPGTYYFTTTSSNCGNRTSPSIVVDCGTNSYATSNNFTGLTNITGGTIIFDGQITIAAGAVVNISGATIIMQQNSSITIQKHSSTGNGGELNLTSCNISSCGDWQGIFVRGMSTAKDVSNGLLYMRSSSIRDANIAIYGDNCARIDVQSTNFDNNYSHLQLNHYNNVTSGHGPDILFSGCNFNALMPAAPLSGLPGFVLAVLNSPKRPMAYLYDVKSVSFLTCTFGCTNYATPPDQIGIDVFDAMGTSSSISGVNAWDCDFTGEFNTAIYMNNGNWSEIGSSGLPTTVTGSFIDGVTVLNGSEVIIQYTDITHASGTLGHTGIKIDQTVNINLHDNKCKYFTNGMEYYFDQSISTNNTYSVLNGNTFDYNTYGLVYAPVCYPIGNVSCNNSHRAKDVSNTSTFDFTCNRFEHNDWGFVGTGDMDVQGSSGGDDWGGFFGDCDWDNSNPRICTTYVSTSAKADIVWYNANPFTVYFYPNYSLYFNSAPACSLLLDNNSVNYISTNCASGLNSLYENSCFSDFKTDPHTGNGKKPFDIKSEPLLDSIVKVFPNPNNGNFFIQNPSKSLYTYKVYSAIGQLVCHGTLNADKTEPIDINTNPKGFYNIVLDPMDGNGKRQVFKIIKTND